MDHDLLEKLTIAVPVYNDGTYIRATVESCLGQAGRVLIYNNASSDATNQIGEDLAAAHPAVRHIRHPANIGAFENFKRSLFACETEYFSWVGSHDKLERNYSMRILQALEKNKNAALATGTIMYIDEDGRTTGQKTKARWTAQTAGKDALDRAGICAAKIKDCFLFYGVYRTEAARAAWFDQPSLGFDRAFVCKVAAQGELLYVPDAVFYARDFVKSRKEMTVNDRRAKVIGKSENAPISKDLLYRNKSMAQTVLDLAQNDRDLARAFVYIDKINRRYSSRRKYQKRRLIYIAGGLAALGLTVAAALLI